MIFGCCPVSKKGIWGSVMKQVLSIVNSCLMLGSRAKQCPHMVSSGITMCRVTLLKTKAMHVGECMIVFIIYSLFTIFPSRRKKG